MIMSNHHIWSTNSGRGGEPKFPINIYQPMTVHCKHCDARTWFTRAQWNAMSSSMTTKQPKQDI